MSLMLRAGTQAAFAAFVLTGLAVLAFYTMFLRVHASGAVAAAVMLGLVAFVTVLVAVCVVVLIR